MIDEKEENKVLSGIRLTLDLLTTSRFQNGKERTSEEWANLVINKAGLSRYTITRIVAFVPHNNYGFFVFKYINNPSTFVSIIMVMENKSYSP